MVCAVCTAAACLLSCLPAGPEDEPSPDMSMIVRWTVNGNMPDEFICRALSPGTVSVELWEDSDCDGNLNDGYYVYGFNCEGGVCWNPENLKDHGSECSDDNDCGGGPGSCLKGAGKTGNYFLSDADTCLQIVLVAHMEDEDSGIQWRADFPTDACFCYCDTPYCESGSAGCFGDYEGYLEACSEACQDPCLDECRQAGFCRLMPGGTGPFDIPECRIDDTRSFSSCRDLGTVDFDLAEEDFGPLAVQVSWETTEAGTYGSCMEAGVGYWGYKIEKLYEPEEGEPFYRTLDELNVERREACMDEMQWALVPFGDYRLTVEGRNESGSMRWEGVCETPDGGDLWTVDDREENSIDCRVDKI
jgi:hypothetical protein